MRIAEVITDTNIGGAGILLSTRLKHSLEKNNFTIVILPRGSRLKHRLEQDGFPTQRIVEIDGCRDRSFEVSAIPKYVKLLHRLKPDIVNCHGCLSCRVAARLCGISAIVYTRHCAYPLSPWQKKFPGKWLVGKAQMLLSHQIVAVAEAAKQNLVDMGVEETRIRVIINGVEGLRRIEESERNQLRERLKIPKEATVIGICARLEECKGHRDFLRAAELLLCRSSDPSKYRFLIIGDGSLLCQLKKICREKGIEEYVIFTGFAEDVAPYFNIMQINVNCSIGTETSSLALSEGMSLGIPAVVSDYGGNPYMVRHGVNGYVYPVGRSDILAKYLERLSEDSGKYLQMSQNSYGRFRDELNAAQMTKHTEALYKKLFDVSKNQIPKRRPATEK